MGQNLIGGGMVWKAPIWQLSHQSGSNKDQAWGMLLYQNWHILETQFYQTYIVILVCDLVINQKWHKMHSLFCQFWISVPKLVKMACGSLLACQPFPHTELQETPVPQTEPQETPVPQTEPQETPVSQTEAQETPVPQTELQETSVPQTELQETHIFEVLVDVGFDPVMD